MDPHSLAPPDTQSIDEDSHSRLLGSLHRSLRHAQNESHLLSSVGAYLHQLTAANFVVHLALAGDEANSEPVYSVLHQAEDALGESLQQWTVNVAIKAITVDQPCIDAANGWVMIGVPIATDQSHGSALVAMYRSDDRSYAFETSMLNSAVNAIERWQFRQTALTDQSLARDIAAINEIGSQLERATTVDSSCQTVASELCDYLHRIREVDIDLVDPIKDTIDVFVASPSAQGQISLTAVSHRDGLPTDLALIEALEAAMGEVICHRQPIEWPARQASQNLPKPATLCHRRLLTDFGESNTFSIPVLEGEEYVGAITITSNQPLSDRQVRFVQAFAPSLGAKFELIRRAQQNRLQRFLNSTWAAIRSNQGQLWLKVLGLAAAIALIPIPYRLSCNCDVSPVTRTFVAAPFESKLSTCLVEPGDLVSKEQTLAQLDDKQIRLELLANEAELHRASKNSDGFIASHQSGEARLAQLEADRITARNRLLTNRVNNLVLKSPIDGVVVAGDMKDSIGRPLEQGETLFEIAPLDQLVVKVQVPEDDIRFVREGMSVSLQLDAFPFQSFEGSIHRIHPASELIDGKNVFVVFVHMQHLPEQTRPGMTGTANISATWRPIGWVYLHKPTAVAARWFGW